MNILTDFFEDSYQDTTNRDYKAEIVQYAEEMINFYNKCDTIEDYFTEIKRDKLVVSKHQHDFNSVIFDGSIEPKDMQIELEYMNRTKKYFLDMAQGISSMPIERGHDLVVIGVKEKTTDTYLGLIRISLPVLSIKPRHDVFGGTVFDGFKLNKHFASGTIIVPTQPFGFNCLGGKLLSLICSSHEIRNHINTYHKNKNICFFETTSLYGSIKPNSQYDGLEPYMKYGGMTESNVLLFPTDKMYLKIKEMLIKYYGKEKYDSFKCGSFKTNSRIKEFNMILKMMENELKDIDEAKYNLFKGSRKKMVAKTRKRYYYTNYGFSNIADVISGNTDELLPGQNYHKHKLENLIEWWRNKAQKRYDKLKAEGRLSLTKEVYHTNMDKMDMIR